MCSSARSYETLPSFGLQENEHVVLFGFDKRLRNAVFASKSDVVGSLAVNPCVLQFRVVEVQLHLV